tara:strand:- start:714 stop:1037 length:324 start_codon:yes stop_codon:yes gene_type:complete
MSFRWPNKDPDEQLDYSIDWSRFLGSATISSVAWFVNNSSGVKTSIGAGVTVNGIQNVSQTTSSDNQTATINLGSGTNNLEYTFFCRITDSTGSQAERSVKLRVRDK